MQRLFWGLVLGGGRSSVRGAVGGWPRGGDTSSWADGRAPKLPRGDSRQSRGQQAALPNLRRAPGPVAGPGRAPPGQAPRRPARPPLPPPAVRRPAAGGPGRPAVGRAVSHVGVRLRLPHLEGGFPLRGEDGGAHPGLQPPLLAGQHRPPRRAGQGEAGRGAPRAAAGLAEEPGGPGSAAPHRGGGAGGLRLPAPRRRRTATQISTGPC